jgi:hypothetical protein
MTATDSPQVRTASVPRQKATDASAIARWCALIAIAAALLTICLAQQGIPRPSALIKMSAVEPMAEFARQSDEQFVFVDLEEHYDGVYYYTIARDPLLLGEEHNRIDLGAYRYGHPAYGWLAHILTLGRDASIPMALMLISLTSMGIAAWAVSRLAVFFGLTPWGGLLIPASPGLLYASTVSTTECFGAALMAVTLLLWLRGRLLLAAVLMVPLCLTKEQYLLVPAGLALWEVVSVWRTRRLPSQTTLRIAAFAAGPIALALWYIYVHAQMGVWPASPGPGNSGLPILGWLDAFSRTYTLANGSFDQSQIGTTATPMLMAMAIVLVIAFVKALPMRTPFDGVVLGMVAFASTLGWKALVYPHEFVRTPSIILLVAVASLFIRPHRGDLEVEGEVTADCGSLY